VVAADPHRRREEPTGAERGVGAVQLPDGAGLGDGDVVEHAERADHHTREQQAAGVDAGAELADEGTGGVVETGQPGQRGERRGQPADEQQ
jgi:hypothetical protein